jgi:CheY-like chemotaxis protein
MPSKLRVMIVDDEPYYLDWLIEFFEAHGYEVITAVNVTEACHFAKVEIFKMVIVDLNVPAGSEMKQAIAESEPVIRQYPGLYVAQYARDIGHWDDQVIIYSVHMGEAITERSKQLYCYIFAQGPPRCPKGSNSNGPQAGTAKDCSTRSKSGGKDGQCRRCRVT